MPENFLPEKILSGSHLKSSFALVCSSLWVNRSSTLHLRTTFPRAAITILQGKTKGSCFYVANGFGTRRSHCSSRSQSGPGPPSRLPDEAACTTANHIEPFIKF